MTEISASFALRLWAASCRNVKLGGLGLLLIAASIGSYCGIVRYLGNVHVVDEGRLYRSARLERNQLEQVIHRYGIKSILNVRGAASGESWYEGEISLSENLQPETFRLWNIGERLGDDRTGRRDPEDTARRPKTDFGPLRGRSRSSRTRLRTLPRRG
jgi:hypothetical protein